MFENTNNDFFLSPWQLSEDGQKLIYKPTADIQEKYQVVFQEVFPNISIQPSTPQGQLITGLTEQDTNDLNLISGMVNSFFNGGEGQWLDEWAWNMFMLKRKTAIPSTVLMNVEGSNGAVITSGFTVSDGTLNYRFDGEYVMPQDGKGSITCICTEVTEKESVAESVVNIVTPLQGIFRVTNPNNSTPATLEESDSDFYNRCIDFGSTYSNSSIQAIASNVANVSGVIKVNAYDNYTDTQQNFKGTQFDANSFGIVVLGGTDDDVAKSIQLNKPCGIAMMGDTSVSLPNQNPRYAVDPAYNKDYKFFRPQNVPLKFEVVVGLHNTSPTNYESIVKSALLWYVNQIIIGGKINLSEASCAILGYANGGFSVNSLKFGKKSSATGIDTISLQFVELATLDQNDITVTTA